MYTDRAREYLFELRQTHARQETIARLWQFLLGMLIFAGFAAMMIWAAGPTLSPPRMMAVALVELVATGAAVYWLMRGGKYIVGSGMIGGYLVATVASWGQLTFLAPMGGGAGLGALVYAVVAGAVLVNVGYLQMAEQSSYRYRL